ncbi:MAG: hypothetical protein QXI89_01630 [Candidatus Anstonellales archaeon]
MAEIKTMYAYTGEDGKLTVSDKEPKQPYAKIEINLQRNEIIIRGVGENEYRASMNNKQAELLRKELELGKPNIDLAAYLFSFQFSYAPGYMSTARDFIQQGGSIQGPDMRYEIEGKLKEQKSAKVEKREKMQA